MQALARQEGTPMTENWRERCAYLRLRSEILSGFMVDLDRLLMAWPTGARSLPPREIWMQALLTAHERLQDKIEQTEMIVSQYHEEATDREAA
jgi:hypothetical protein